MFDDHDIDDEEAILMEWNEHESHEVKDYSELFCDEEIPQSNIENVPENIASQPKVSLDICKNMKIEEPLVTVKVEKSHINTSVNRSTKIPFISVVLNQSHRRISEIENLQEDSISYDQDKIQLLPPSESNYISFMKKNGQISYLKKSDDISTAVDHDINLSQPKQLLSEPIDILIDKAMTNQINEKYLQSQVQHHRMTINPIVSSINSTNTTTTTSTTNASYKDTKRVDSSLWVEKYKPKHFLELLSPEQINREVLRSVKEWDKYVFKKDKKISSLSKRESIDKFKNSYTGSTSSTSNSSNNNTYKSIKHKSVGSDNMDITTNNDNDNTGDNNETIDRDLIDKFNTNTSALKDCRPHMKVILLSGPPGTGKTTLAHILALHCGYRPYEINASDDRTSEVLKTSITSAMTSNTITGDKRPNCIILDEVDGIDNTSTIDMIVKIVTTPLKNQFSITGTELAQETLNQYGSKPKKTTKFHGTPLIRPLICICNDHYAPVLKTLKKHAQIFIFQPPTQSRLVQRLQSICISERVTVHATLLHELCTITGNDIRSCINTLQFACTQSITYNSNTVSVPHPPITTTTTTTSTTTGTKTSEISESIDINSISSNDRIHVKHYTNKTLGNHLDIDVTLQSMICHGLSDKQQDLFTIWKKLLHTEKKKKQQQQQQSSSNIQSMNQLMTSSSSSTTTYNPIIMNTNYSHNGINNTTRHVFVDTATSSSNKNTSSLLSYDMISNMILDSGEDETMIIHGLHENMYLSSLSHLSTGNYSQSMKRYANGTNNTYNTSNTHNTHTSGCGSGSGSIWGIFDADMSRTALSLEWLSLSDSIDHFARYSIGGYTMLHYLPMAAVAIHYLSDRSHMLSMNQTTLKIQWPIKDRTEHYKREQHYNILHAITYNPLLDYTCRCTLSYTKSLVITDVLSYILDILSPKIRPIAYTSLSPIEKTAIQDVVAKMAICGLNYTTTSHILDTTSYRPYNKYNTTTKYSTNKYGTSAMNTTNDQLVFEPNFTVLLDYSSSPSYDTTTERNNVYKKRIVNQDSTNNTTRNTSVAVSSYVQEEVCVHTALNEETKQIIYKELKTYLITEQANKLKKESSSSLTHNDTHTKQNKSHHLFKTTTIPTTVVAAKISDVKHNDSADIKENTHTVNYTEVIKDSVVVNYNVNNKGMKPMKGRMDMFFNKKSEPSKIKLESSKGPFNTTSSTQLTTPDNIPMQSIGDSQESYVSLPKPASNVYYKFKQGFSNAVKRSVKISEFLS